MNQNIIQLIGNTPLVKINKLNPNKKAGMLCGAAMHVALEKAKELDTGLIVVLLPDRGEKYLSTTLFKE